MGLWHRRWKERGVGSSVGNLSVVVSKVVNSRIVSSTVVGTRVVGCELLALSAGTAGQAHGLTLLEQNSMTP